MRNEIKINYLTCKICQHRWVPRGENVYVCPKCKSYKWNEPKKDVEKKD